MKATRGNRGSLRAPVLIAAVAGLALSASGCFVGSSSPIDTDRDGIEDAFDDCPLDPEDFNGVQDGDGCPETVCIPDLTVFWEIRSDLAAGAPLRTCQQAGNADTVTAWIDGGGLAVLTAFDAPCPAAASTGSFIAELPSSGTYNVSLELTTGAARTLLSETPILVQPVSCAGTSATPVADLRVNF